MEPAQTTNTPSPETIWAILREVSEMQKETAKRQEETRQIIRELSEDRKEYAKQLKEYAKQQNEYAERQKETDRAFKESKDELNRKLGEYINLFGEVTEYEIAPNLREKFIELGLEFPRANRNVSVKDKGNNTILEIDVMLENGDKAILVEVKTKLTVERINNHIIRLEKMRSHADLYGDKRKFLGAVAAVIVTDETRNYALNQGLYLIEPAGKDLNITAPNGKPKEW
jgi:ribosomal protein L9